ncbi:MULTISPECIES: hypothetical protein [unclassified Collinsella]|uniref:hypothetical protein n=1 Tax=unclassified Collinsella TaxID=2637548 RepID=UPI0011C8AE73|nr:MULTISPECIES: hypothetical protein [unclassified Collinsella]TXF37506.1 hypothetical protein E4J93_02990 [Collinsella sp. BA40]
MTDQQDTPLTAEERAELEELRAEKARREAEERARRERAELEQLRAERAAAEAPQPAPGPARARRVADEPPAVNPENLTFGQKMVMTKDEVDDDGIPPMPPAQKIIIVVALVALVAGMWWLVQGNLG